MTWTDLILAAGWKLFLLLLAIAAGGAGIAFPLFKKYGEKWLDGEFAERLERLKHDTFTLGLHTVSPVRSL